MYICIFIDLYILNVIHTDMSSTTATVTSTVDTPETPSSSVVTGGAADGM